jgi:hypothetical protein
MTYGKNNHLNSCVKSNSYYNNKCSGKKRIKNTVILKTKFVTLRAGSVHHGVCRCLLRLILVISISWLAVTDWCYKITSLTEKYFYTFIVQQSLKLFINMKYFFFVCNRVSNKPELSFMSFSRFRSICIVYNNPSVANSVILMIYCWQFCNL